jgi:hypothetical protein
LETNGKHHGGDDARSIVVKGGRTNGKHHSGDDARSDAVSDEREVVMKKG